MGTRADFYAGRGSAAEWLGSIAFDGLWIDEDDRGGPAVLGATTESEYRAACVAFLARREDATLPEQGWPWPWNDSGTTDCAYAFDSGKVWCSRGAYWYDPRVPRDGEGEVLASAKDSTPVVWPDMSDRKRVTYGPRSGIILLSVPKEGSAS